MIAPILRDIPETLATERLVLSTFRAGVGAEVHRAVTESMDRLLPWMPWVKEGYSLEQAEEFARRSHAQFIMRESLNFLIWHRRTSELIGVASLHDPKWSVAKFEIGYWCRSRCEGQGYITEAADILTDFAFAALDAKRLEIRCDSRNLRSRRVAERAGYQLDAELRNDAIAPDGTVRTTLVFAKFPKENAL